MSRTGMRAVFAAIIGVVLLIVASAIPVAASAHNNAPGNNGTVKIHEGGLEPNPVIRDQPKVCTFHLHFFFADQGQKGSWWIQSWSPTGEKATVLSGKYETDENGEYRTPASPDAYSLPNGHYKLFWQGRNDRNVKHKVFWVECEAPTPTPTPTATPTPTPTKNPTPTPTITPTPTPTETPSPTPTEKPTPTATPSPSPSETATSSPSEKPTVPPTDTINGTNSGSSSQGLLWVLVLLTAATGTAMFLRPKRQNNR